MTLEEAKRIVKADPAPYYPKGKSDNGGRWYPADDERCPLCDGIRSPSRAYPWSYYKHCMSITHRAHKLMEREEAVNGAEAGTGENA